MQNFILGKFRRAKATSLRQKQDAGDTQHLMSGADQGENRVAQGDPSDNPTSKEDYEMESRRPSQPLQQTTKQSQPLPSSNHGGHGQEGPHEKPEPHTSKEHIIKSKALTNEERERMERDGAMRWKSDEDKEVNGEGINPSKRSKAGKVLKDKDAVEEETDTLQPVKTPSPDRDKNEVLKSTRSASSEKCIICFASAVDCTIKPCEHSIYCFECILEWLGSERGQQQCAKCHRTADSVVMNATGETKKVEHPQTNSTQPTATEGAPLISLPPPPPPAPPTGIQCRIIGQNCFKRAWYSRRHRPNEARKTRELYNDLQNPVNFDAGSQPPPMPSCPETKPRKYWRRTKRGLYYAFFPLIKLSTEARFFEHKEKQPIRVDGVVVGHWTRV